MNMKPKASYLMFKYLLRKCIETIIYDFLLQMLPDINLGHSIKQQKQ